MPVAIPFTNSDPGLDIRAFLVTKWEGEPVNAAPGEHDDRHWFRASELVGLTLADPASLPDIVNAILSEIQE